MVRRNAFKLAIACDGTQDCVGNIKVRSVRKVQLPNGTTRKITLAQSAYSVESGTRARIKLELTRRGRAALGSKRMRVVAFQNARGSESASTTFWLRRR